MNKKTLWLVIELVLIAAALVTIFLTRPKAPGQTNSTETTNSSQTTDNTEDNKTSFAVVVVHKDGSKKEMTLQTQEKYLGAALIEAGIVEAEENRFGMHIKTADGEKAVFEEDKAYWAVYSGEELAGKATDLLEIEEGRIYKLVCTQPAPLTSADDTAEHLFYNVFQPLARGYIGTTWETAKAFAQYMGYEAIIDEGVYSIQSTSRSHVFFGGDLTTAGDSAELADAVYQVYTDGHAPARAGVKGRYEDSSNPENHRENPVYFIDGFVENGWFNPVQTLNDVAQYILDYGTLKLKFFTLVVQDTFGQPKNTYQVVTSEDYMGPALEYAGYITIGQDDTGAYIKQVQGVSPAAGAAWLLWKGNSYKTLPIDTTPVEHGATYNLVYKRIR